MIAFLTTNCIPRSFSQIFKESEVVIVNSILNGFQCQKCNIIYDQKEKAVDCESKPIEQPLLRIGDTLVDYSYDVKKEFKVTKIYFHGHQVCYILSWQDLDVSEEWKELFTVFGNEDLKKKYKFSPNYS